MDGRGAAHPETLEIWSFEREEWKRHASMTTMFNKEYCWATVNSVCREISGHTALFLYRQSYVLMDGRGAAHPETLEIWSFEREEWKWPDRLWGFYCVMHL
jgi:hypothetical protein